MRILRMLFALFVGLAWLVGCSGGPAQVEVTRLVSRDVPVTVEVTRVVVQEVIAEVTREAPVEVTVEVTRLVSATSSPPPAATPLPAASATPSPTAAALPGDGAVYTVQPGDTLDRIAALTGVSAIEIQRANNLTDANQIVAGQTLVIPGWDGVPLTGAAAPTATAAGAAATATQPPATGGQGANLLPNPSFEGDWYFYLYNELQIPVGWQLTINEGPNTLDPGPGGTFFRPEVRVITTADLPAPEQALFVFDGNKTVKAFKGGAPTTFALFTDVALPAGRYRFQINFFTDTVIAYEGGQKVFAPDPLAAEARIIFNQGGTDWLGTLSGQRNSLMYEFTLTEPQTVRLGGDFRNRFVMANNSWFLDDWSLYALP